jgi:hypothetical protein
MEPQYKTPAVEEHALFTDTLLELEGWLENDRINPPRVSESRILTQRRTGELRRRKIEGLFGEHDRSAYGPRTFSTLQYSMGWC